LTSAGFELLGRATVILDDVAAATAAVARFVHLALTVDVPAGWFTQPGHQRHADHRRTVAIGIGGLGDPVSWLAAVERTRHQLPIDQCQRHLNPRRDDGSP
jgi:hypothetical protein